MKTVWKSDDSRDMREVSFAGRRGGVHLETSLLNREDGRQPLFTNVCYEAVRWLFVAVFGALTASLLLFVHTIYRVSVFKQAAAALAVMAVLALIYGIVLLLKNRTGAAELLHKKPAVFLVTGMGFLFFSQMGLIYLAHVPMGWDVGLVAGTASMADMTLNRDVVQYFINYPNNLFLLFFERAYIALAKPQSVEALFWGLGIVNTVFVDVGIALAAMCAKRIWGMGAACGAFVMSCLLLGLSPWILVPYSDTLPIPFIMLCLWGYLRLAEAQNNRARIGWAVLCGASAAVGALFKPSALILPVALVLVQLVRLLPRPSVLLRALPWGGVALVVFGLFTGGFRLYTNNQTQIGVFAEGAFPPSHFMAMGLVTRGEGPGRWVGGYNEPDVGETRELYITEEMDAYNREKIRDRIADLGGAGGYALYLVDKARWVTGDGSFFWGMEGLTDSFEARPANWLTEFWYPTGQNFLWYRYLAQGVWIVSLVFGVVCACMRKKSAVLGWEAVLYASLIGQLLFTLLFEGRSRYFILFLPFFAMLAGKGGVATADGLVRRFSNRVKRVPVQDS